MKHRHTKKSSPETAFYREIDRRMSVDSADYDRLRVSAGLTVEPTPTPLPRSSIARALTAVAATLVLASLMIVPIVWIADRLRDPAHDLPPITGSETAESAPSDDSAEPAEESIPDTIPETELETVPTAAPRELTVGGITYRKTKSCLPAERIGEALYPMDAKREEPVCYAVRNLPTEEGMAVLWGDCFVLYLNEVSVEIIPPSTPETNGKKGIFP